MKHSDSKLQKKTIMLMAGGTGGHIFPALAVGNELRHQGWRLHWLGSVGGMEQELVPQHDIAMTLLPVSGVRGKGLVSLIKAPFQLLRCVWLARKAIKTVKPDVVLGMGGFASGPGGLAAKLCGVPLVIHEQNAVAGMTNKQLHRMSTKTLQAYPGAFGSDTKDAESKVGTTGNPVRKDFLEIPSAAERMKNEDGKVNILVVGGSRGALAFNQRLPATMNLVNSGLQVNVRHQAGKGNSEAVRSEYEQGENPKVTFEVTDFIGDMAQAYQWADLVVCRAGALTVAEVAMAGCAAIFVPYPYAVDDHQTFNARYLADKGAAIVIQQHDLDEARLAQEITALANNKAHLIEMAQKAREMAHPNATETVANWCKAAAQGNSSESLNNEQEQ